jgi:hypothetical protein
VDGAAALALDEAEDHDVHEAEERERRQRWGRIAASVLLEDGVLPAARYLACEALAAERGDDTAQREGDLGQVLDAVSALLWKCPAAARVAVRLAGVLRLPLTELEPDAP